MYKGFLTFFVLITIVTAACPASYNINNLLAGTLCPKPESVTFNADGSSRQNYTSPFPKQFASTPSLALGTSLTTQAFRISQSSTSEPADLQSTPH